MPRKKFRLTVFKGVQAADHTKVQPHNILPSASDDPQFLDDFFLLRVYGKSAILILQSTNPSRN